MAKAPTDPEILSDSGLKSATLHGFKVSRRIRQGEGWLNLEHWGPFDDELTAIGMAEMWCGLLEAVE